MARPLGPRHGVAHASLASSRALRAIGNHTFGDGARAVAEWARVWRALRESPRLRGALLAGEVSWTVARKIVGFVIARERSRVSRDGPG